MRVPVGGRGKTVPYETITVRVPAPIRDEVDDLSARFRAKVFGTDIEDGDDTDNDVKKLARLVAVIERYKSLSKNTRDWVHANKLMAELEAEIGKN